MYVVHCRFIKHLNAILKKGDVTHANKLLLAKIVSHSQYKKEKSIKEIFLYSQQ